MSAKLCVHCDIRAKEKYPLNNFGAKDVGVIVSCFFEGQVHWKIQGREGSQLCRLEVAVGRGRLGRRLKNGDYLRNSQTSKGPPKDTERSGP